VLFHYGGLLGAVADQPAISKSHAPQAQMGNLMANIYASLTQVQPGWINPCWYAAAAYIRADIPAFFPCLCPA